MDVLSYEKIFAALCILSVYLRLASYCTGYKSASKAPGFPCSDLDALATAANPHHHLGEARV